MVTKKIVKLSLIVFIFLLAACGSNPATTSPSAAPQRAELDESTAAPVGAPAASSEMPAAAIESVSNNATTTTNDTPAIQTGLTYPIVDTNQTYCYDNTSSISCPSEGQAFYGQDGQYAGNVSSYTNNGDGTVTDNVTGLMWQQDSGEKMTYDQAVAGAPSFNLAGYSDWRLPSIKELYSLIQFSGTDSHPCVESGTCTMTPFLDTDYFAFSYGDTAAGERMIDSQWATSTKYVFTTMHGDDTMFGVNFADGRIKGYGTDPMPGQSTDKTFFVIYVRGNDSYGINDFVDNGDGTIADQATGLTWMQSDNGEGLDWESALAYCTSMDYAGSTDWRLPDAKELQSILDYSRSPDTTNSAAIDPIFSVSTISNEEGVLDYPTYWSSTTHNQANGGSSTAVYIAFGRGLGYMNGEWLDVHGAGTQRSETKAGDPADYPTGHGPQGDAVRVYNYVRCVTGGTGSDAQVGGAADTTPIIEEGQPPAGQGGTDNAATGDQPPQIDFASAAAELGVTEQALMSAMGDPTQGRPDLTAVSIELGVTEQALVTALGLPAGGPPTQ